jgi:hypothetical protein
MSQESVDGFRKAIAGYNRGEIGPMLEITDPEAEWYPFTAAVEGNEAYHGNEGLRRWWENVDASFVTPVDTGVARPLVEGLSTETVVTDSTAAEIFELQPRLFAEAVRKALREQDEEA